MLLSTVWNFKRRNASRRQQRRRPQATEAVRQASPAVQNLEQRIYLTVSTLFADGELSVVIDEGNDSVAVGIDPSFAGRVQVLVNGVPDGSLPPLQASDVQVLTVIGSDAANRIDLSAVSLGTFNFLDNSTNPATTMQINVDAGNGDDTIIASDGFDATLTGGNGDDVISPSSGLGNLTINAGDGDDIVTGGDGNDTINAGDGDDTVEGGVGDDSVLAGDGMDTVSLSAGNDFADGGDGADTITGGVGDDTIRGDEGADLIFGEDGNDSLHGGLRNDTIDGGFGNDEIDGAAGDDLIDGSFNRDTIRGGSGDDSIDGGGGQDVINGQHGEDTINGGPNEDTIFGGGRNDILNGDAENDVILGQGGIDTIDGGEGFDQLDDGASRGQTSGGGVPDPILNRLIIGDVAMREAGEFLPNGTFFTSSVDPEFINTGDFNNDGITDLVISEPIAPPFPGAMFQTGFNNIGILLGDGMGNFTVSAVVDSTILMGANGHGSGDIGVGDWNGDGFEDIVVLNTTTDNVTIYFGDGTGLMTDAMGVVGMATVVGTGDGPVAIDVGDLDNDGDLDFFIASAAGDQLSIMTNNGAGTFANANIAVPGANPQGVALIDHENDGDLDIALSQGMDATGVSADVVIIENTNGMGALAVSTSTLIPNGIAGRLVTGDFNADGFADLGVGDTTGQNYHIMINDTMTMAPNFAVTPLTNLDGSIAGGIDGTVDDFDGDGDQDIVIVNGGTTIDTFINDDGLGLFVDGASQPGSLTTFGNGRQDVVSAQFDGDVSGLPDVVTPLDFFGAELFVNDAFGLIDPTAELELVFDVTLLPGDVPVEVQVDFSVDDDTAVNVLDFDVSMVNLPSPITFTVADQVAGNLRQQIIVPITPDLTTETTEQFNVTLSNAFGADILDDMGNVVPSYSATGTIVETLGEIDSSISAEIPLIRVDSVVVSPELDDDRQLLTFTVSVADAAPTQVVTVDYTTTDGTALADADYLTEAGTLTFTGSGTQTIDVVVIADLTPELDEFFFLDLSNATGGGLIAAPRGFATILNDDGAIPALFGDTVIGSEGADTLFGSRHPDVISGRAGNDVINGNLGNDTIFGGSGADTINGGGDDDVVSGQGGQDVVAGNDGDDRIVFRGTGDGQDTFTFEPGFDIVAIEGSAGSNTLTIGQDSGDLVISEGTAQLRISGDGIGFSAGGQVVQVNGNAGNDNITVGNIDDVGFFVLQVDGGIGNDTINGSGARIGSVVLTLDGGEGNDMITGTGGNDLLLGSDGDDTLLGRSGNDSLMGGNGDDSLNGQAGDDTADGGFGNDNIQGEAGDDVLNGDFGNDSLTGGDGDDTITGGFGNDLANGNDGDDSLLGLLGRDTLLGGLGADTLDGGRDEDVIRGHAGNDVLRGDHGADRIFGGGGDDTIDAGDGDDFVNGGSGNDGVDGGDGNDTINGMDGRDTLFGGDGDDVITGGNGSDVLVGHDGDDTLTGNNKRDTLAGNLGDDNYGTPGTDLVPDLIDDAFVLNAAQLANIDATTP